MSPQLRQFAIVLACVFIGAAGTQFLANAVNVFESDWSTWQVVVNSGVVAVVTYVVAYLAPFQKTFGIGSK